CALPIYRTRFYRVGSQISSSSRPTRRVIRRPLRHQSRPEHVSLHCPLQDRLEPRTRTEKRDSTAAWSCLRTSHGIQSRKPLPAVANAIRLSCRRAWLLSREHRHDLDRTHRTVAGALCRRSFQQSVIAAEFRLCISRGGISFTRDAVRTNSPSRGKLCDSKGFVNFFRELAVLRRQTSV